MDEHPAPGHQGPAGSVEGDPADGRRSSSRSAGSRTHVPGALRVAAGRGLGLHRLGAHPGRDSGSVLRPGRGRPDRRRVGDTTTAGTRPRARRLLGDRADSRDRTDHAGQSQLLHAGRHHCHRAAGRGHRRAREPGRRRGRVRCVPAAAVSGPRTPMGGDPVRCPLHYDPHAGGHRPGPGPVQVRCRPGRPAPCDRRARRGPGERSAGGGAGEGAHAGPGARAGRARAARRPGASADADRDESGVRRPRALLRSRGGVERGGGGRAHEPRGGRGDAHMGTGPEPCACRERLGRGGPGGGCGVVPRDGTGGEGPRRARPARAHSRPSFSCTAPCRRA